MTGDEIRSQTDGATALAGSVERIVYHDPRSRYTVMRLRVDGELELVTIVGRSDALEQGAAVQLEGTWSLHPSHGRQFEFVRIRVPTPTTIEGIRRRLTRYPGVRDAMAERIVRRFGLDTLEILDRSPRRLLEVEGIGPRTLERIVEFHATRNGPIADLESQLLELDLPPHLALAIHARYGAAGTTMLRTRPYRLARDVRGIAFLTADRIARALGIAPEGEERIDAGVLHVMERAENDGHCGLPLARVLELAAEMLKVPAELVEAGVRRLVESADLVLESADDGIILCFLHRLVVLEERVASRLAELAEVSHDAWKVPDLPMHLGAEQIEAIRVMASCGVMVLTGGPGTGKSTVVRNVLDLARANGIDACLCAPTGRAAKRLEQTTGVSAATVHRILEFQPDSGRFLHGSENPLPPALVVVDESSMLDVGLADALLSALTPEHRLMLVGDADQLPSVGPGNVLRDIIGVADDAGGAIGVVRLHTVYRQAFGSSIIANAHRILSGEHPRADESGSGGEFFIIAARSSDHAHDLVLRTVLERIPEAYGFDPVMDVQILCPMHKGRTGTEAFNHALQDHHGAGRKYVELAGDRRRRFFVGDRVMQTRNDYERNVFNGDVGVVKAVDVEANRLVVDMEGTMVAYEGKDMAALQLAYAITIHKSQGSEFPAVVVPILSDHHVMLRRNLLYTAVTRARRLCVLVGDYRAVERAVRRADAARRFTGLARRLRRRLGAGPHWVADLDPA